jgi:glycine cleavage system regulatory protein
MAAERVLAMKKKQRKQLKQTAQAPSQKTIDRLRRKLWEFSEEIRLDAVAMREQ